MEEGSQDGEELLYLWGEGRIRGLSGVRMVGGGWVDAVVVEVRVEGVVGVLVMVMGVGFVKGGGVDGLLSCGGGKGGESLG